MFTAGLIDSQLTPVFFVLFLVGAFLVLRKERPVVKNVLFLWILVPNIILLFLPRNKLPRHLIPMLPAIAVMAALGIRYLWPRWYGKAIAGTALLLGVVQFFSITYACGLPLHTTQRGRISYYRYTMEQPLPAALKSGTAWRSMYDYMKAHYISLHGRPGTLRYFVPFRGAGTLGMEDFLGFYFWLNDPDFRTQGSLLVKGGLQNFAWLREHLDEFDFIVFCLPARDLPLLRRDPDVLFYMTAKYYGLRNNERPVKDEGNWRRHKETFDAIVRAFPIHVLVYQDRKVAAFVYARPALQHDKEKSL
jgi:hypothetical protein